MKFGELGLKLGLGLALYLDDFVVLWGLCWDYMGLYRVEGLQSRVYALWLIEVGALSSEG